MAGWSELVDITDGGGELDFGVFGRKPKTDRSGRIKVKARIIAKKGDRSFATNMQEIFVEPAQTLEEAQAPLANIEIKDMIKLTR